MPETPRYLLSQGKDQAVVDAVNYVARQNGKPEPLTLGMLQAIDSRLGMTPASGETSGGGLSTREIIQENIKEFRGSHYAALFATRKLSFHTALIWVIWLVIGVAYPLYFNFLPSYLATRFTEASSLDLTYRNYCIQSAVGVVGPLSAAFLVNTFLGRRWMMGISAIITGVFLFAYVGVTTQVASLAFTCVTGLLGNFGTSLRFTHPNPLLSTNVFRIRGHVRIHARVLPSPTPWNRDRNSGVASASWWACGQYSLIADGVHDRAALCECGAVGCCWVDLLWVAV
jgi:hypothetical protein